MKMKKFIPHSTVCALAVASAFQSAAAATQPYPSVPLIWQAGTLAIKPNILLFIDTSGSMKPYYRTYYTKDVMYKGQWHYRSEVAQAVAKEVITETRENNNWGLMTFTEKLSDVLTKRDGIYVYDTLNPSPRPVLPPPPADVDWESIGGKLKHEVSDVSSTTGNSNYNSLMSTIDSLVFYTNTPIPSAYYEAIRYFRGLPAGTVAHAPELNYTSPIKYRCQKNYIIFISDGEPTGFPLRYQLGRLWHHDSQLIGDSALRNAIQTGATGYQDGGLATARIAWLANNTDMIKQGLDAEGKSFDDSTGSPSGQDFGKQTIRTYTVGFRANVNLLREMAEQGGGEYFTADKGEELKAALTKALNAIARDAGYSNALSSISKDASGKITASASTTMNPSTWTSELRFYKYLPASKSFDLTSYGKTQYTETGSNMLTSRALFSTPTGVVQVTQNAFPSDFNNATFGIDPTRPDMPSIGNNTLFPITLSNDSNEYKKLMQWLLRWGPSDVVDNRYRDRNQGSSTGLSRYMGDVSGNVVSFGDVVVRASDPSDFDRRKFMAVPSNDGMLHILQANTGSDKNTHPYTEVLQYVPGTMQRGNASDTVLRNLVFTAEKSYSAMQNPKQSFVAGELLQVTTEEGEHTLISSMGSGARGSFALMVGGKDKSNSPVGLDAGLTQAHTNVPMWDNSTGTYGAANSFYNQIGYQFGGTKVGYVAMDGSTKKWTSGDVRVAAMMTNGMDAPNSPQLGLYVLDHMAKNYSRGGNLASTGTRGNLIKHIPISRAFTASSNSESSAQQIIDAHDGLTAPQGIDINDDGIIDLVYAGDFKGNIWRFDLRGDNSTWGARQVYKSEGNQPIIAEPNLINWHDGKVGIYFGTGSNLYQGDLTSVGNQSLYGIFDDYQNCAVGDTTGDCRPTERSDLLSQTLKATTNSKGGEAFTISTSAQYTDQSKRRGFYMDLPANYRVTTTPEVLTVSTKAAGAIWNIEKIVGSNKTTPKMTCTPDSTSASGYRIIADANNGMASESVFWGTKVERNGTDIIVSVAYTGASSRSIFLTNSQAALSSTGVTRSGVLAQKGSNENCRATQNLVSQTSTGGSQVNQITCLGNDPVRLNRLSWREIF